MNTKLKSLLLLIVTAMLLFVVGTAYATTPTSGGGSFDVISATLPYNVRYADGNLVYDQTLTFNYYNGDLVGSTIAVVTCVAKSSGETTCNGRETFDGFVGTNQGTLVFNIMVKLVFPDFHGRWTVIDGTGALVNLKGTGTFEGDVINGGTYTLGYHLDP